MHIGSVLYWGCLGQDKSEDVFGGLHVQKGDR